MVVWKTIKSLEILEKPEAIFNRRLTDNPYHPFQRDQDGSKLNIVSISASLVAYNGFIFIDYFTEFVLHLGRRRCYYGVFMSVVCALIITVWFIADEAGQYMVFPMLVGCLSAWFAYENKADRICTLDSRCNSYSVALGGNTVQEGEIRNVYVRLKAQKHGAGHMYYYVVFNGYHMAEQKVTSYSKNDKRLRVLAKRLAENLDINYFDVKTSSKERILEQTTTLLCSLIIILRYHASFIYPLFPFKFNPTDCS
ncbi:hypothetical protein QZH41_014623 [Actinostola sp. cb2023]|nr:hypothetical protein QZH41_014623 [Actinostola sp. cb2023]